MSTETGASRTANSDTGDDRPGLVRSAAVFASGTLLSRVFGLVRDIAMAALVPQAARASFLVAFRIPNTFRGLMAEGAASAAYVPVMAEYTDEHDRTSLRSIVGSLRLATLCIVGGFVIAAMVAAPHLLRPIQWLTHVSRGTGLSSEEMAATGVMLRCLFPYLLMLAMAAVSMAALNTVHHFAAPSVAPVLFNISIIAACMLSTRYAVHPGYVLAVGVLVGGAAQVALQDGTLRWRGLAPIYGRPVMHPALGRMGRLLLPALVGYGVAEINALVDTFFAGSLGPGAVNGLYYANRLAQLPMGVFGVAIATTALPALAHSFSRNQTEEGVRTLHDALGLGLFFTIPATCALIVFGGPMVRLLFEYGNFDETATLNTVRPLVFYGLGLASFAGLKATVSAFYGLQRPHVPVAIATCCMVVNIVLNVLLVRPMQQAGLALATTLSATLNWTLLLVMLRVYVGPLGLRRLGIEALKTLCAATVAVTAGWCALNAVRAIVADPAPASVIARLVYVVIPLTVTGGVYMWLSVRFKVSALAEVLSTVRKSGLGQRFSKGQVIR